MVRDIIEIVRHVANGLPPGQPDPLDMIYRADSPAVTQGFAGRWKRGLLLKTRLEGRVPAQNMHVKLRPGRMIPTPSWAIRRLGRRATRLRRSFF
jgi:hypothetical protein